ncbi:helicase-related protein [Arthrobacter sedimenti]|uniref:helicase-related protein n=1 Tax=Arthrobacter sedimenti TaxID=2694931 RepID=UPI00142E582D|nr:helicase-related protein [Arthrobacter sedimenti]
MLADNSCGYHPQISDLASLVSGSTGRVLLVAPRSKDLGVDHEYRVLHSPDHDISLRPGIYWAKVDNEWNALVVDPEAVPERTPRPAEEVALSNADESSLGVVGMEWLDEWWGFARTIASPAFPASGGAISRSSGRDVIIRRRQLTGSNWSYVVRQDGRTVTVSESELAPIPEVSASTSWLHHKPATAESFSAMITRAKLNRGVTDALFSYGVTKTIINPFQFKPVLKYLDSSMERMLIADEVGLGKTIEAGLLWTEMAARGQANRVMVVCPAALVPKWQREMSERFGFTLEHYTTPDLRRLVDRLEAGTVPQTFAVIVSIQTFRTFDRLQRMEELNFGLDLCIVDEAHQMRNQGTASLRLGFFLRDVSGSLVLLSATPLNLGNRDLLSMMRLIMPGEVESQADLELRIDHHKPLQALRKSATDPSISNLMRRQWLLEIASSRMGRALRARAAFKELEELLIQDDYTVASAPIIRDACNQLHGLSSAITRTRKTEVRTTRAVREAKNAEVIWTADEQAFYDAYVEWLRQIAAEREIPTGFALQMPLRLASSCLPAAAKQVLGLKVTQPSDGDGDSPSASRPSSFLASEVPPSNVKSLAEKVLKLDTKFAAFTAALASPEMARRSTLVFTFSRNTLDYLHRHLSQTHRVAVLHGGIVPEDRESIMKRFRAGEFELVIATRVASEGLDFEFCSMIVNYDLPWNPMEVEQRIGRLDRIGQTSDKILILNFSTPGTIESSILERLLDRVGVFEHSIGELEPILAEKFESLSDIVVDFRLTADERERRINEAIAAVEQGKSDAAELEESSSRLQAEDQFGIKSVEERISRGRYLGQIELAHLVADWARLRGGLAVVNQQDKTLRVNVNQEMLHKIVEWRRGEGLTSAEVTRVERAGQAKAPLIMCLDAEEARVNGGSLLNGHHPLVRVASEDYESHHTPRFAVLRTTGDSHCPQGTYLIALAATGWKGLRPTSELWVEAVDLESGRSVSAEAGALLMTAVAEGALKPANDLSVHPDADVYCEQLLTDLELRRHDEQEKRRGENDALILDRQVRAEEIFKNHQRSIQERIREATVQTIRMFEGQLRRAEERRNDALARIASSAHSSLDMENLALLQLEVI